MSLPGTSGSLETLRLRWVEAFCSERVWMFAVRSEQNASTHRSRKVSNDPDVPGNDIARNIVGAPKPATGWATAGLAPVPDPISLLQRRPRAKTQPTGAVKSPTIQTYQAMTLPEMGCNVIVVQGMTHCRSSKACHRLGYRRARPCPRSYFSSSTQTSCKDR
jgi:hypothetical protein